MNETEQVIDGLDEVEIANTSIDEIDSENINLIFVGIDKSGSMGMYERDGYCRTYETRNMRNRQSKSKNTKND